MIFFGTTGLDAFTQQEIVNPRATAWSVFNDQLTAAGATPIFTLNRFTFASGYGHLMPRAVAHSAGLINFFFRGRLDAEVSPDRADVLLVKNLAAEAMEGQFALYYDDATGTRHLLPVADCRIADAPQPVVEGRCRTTLAPAATDAAARLDFTFVFPANPPPRLEGEYVVVFTGRMGQEQPDAGARGAIAAKVLKRPPYNGALYVAGLDAANRIVTFKVDRDGLRILNGLTPDGQLRNTPPNIQLPGQKDFDPLFPIVQSFGGAVQGRLARMKQVAFDGDGAAMTHELKALAMRRKDGTFLTYTRLAPGGPFKTGGSFRWVAHDPVQGNYEFFVQTAITGLDATVFWQRQFSDTPGGPPRTTGGSFALPTFPGAFTSGVTPGNVNYHGFETGQLLVSPDGLTVSGFQDVPNINGQTFVRSLDIKITLGASPSALLVERENLASSTVLRNIVINESTSSGPGPPPEVHLVTHALNTIDRAGTRLGNRAFVDYIRGPMVTFLAETAASLLDVGANDSTIDIDFSPIVGCPQTRTDVRVNSSRFAFKSIETTTVMLDQAIVGERRDIPQFIAGNPMNWSSHGQITQIDSFPCDTDPVIGTPVRIGGDIVFDPDIVSPSPKFTGQSLVRTLNGRVDGSIISDTLLPGQSLIRGHAFPFNQEFVADASPLGEIFFATTNKSLIVYDPGRSGLPATLAIPPNIVKIVAALWL
jgi:hypothetical protein